MHPALAVLALCALSEPARRRLSNSGRVLVLWLLASDAGGAKFARPCINSSHLLPRLDHFRSTPLASAHAQEDSPPFDDMQCLGRAFQHSHMAGCFLVCANDGGLGPVAANPLPV